MTRAFEAIVVVSFLGAFIVQELLRAHGSAAAIRASNRGQSIFRGLGALFVAVISWELFLIVT